jgi:hypothetical protein
MKRGKEELGRFRQTPRRLWSVKRKTEDNKDKSTGGEKMFCLFWKTDIGMYRSAQVYVQ